MRGASTKNRAVSMTVPSHVGRKVNMMKRSCSAPGTQGEVFAVKSAMRVSSLDESLHKKGLAKNPARPSGIEWHEIRIREYVRAIGDNPSCSAGPPVSIGWEYNPKEIALKVEKYEEKRPQRRSMQEMVLPREVRFKMLTQEWGVPRKDCANATRESLKVKNHRRQTVRNMGKVNPKMEEAMENAGKKFKRVLSFKKKTSTEVEQMMEEADKAASKLSAIAAKDYVWESDEQQTSESLGMPYEDQEHAPEEDGDEPETARPPRSSPSIAKVVRAPPRRSLNGSNHGKPIIISEDDCVA